VQNHDVEVFDSFNVESFSNAELSRLSPMSESASTANMSWVDLSLPSLLKY
jgi:hypothetical protein